MDDFDNLQAEEQLTGITPEELREEPEIHSLYSWIFSLISLSENVTCLLNLAELHEIDREYKILLVDCWRSYKVEESKWRDKKSNASK